MGGGIKDRWKRAPKWKKYIIVPIAILSFILVIVIISNPDSFETPNSEPSKRWAYNKCLLKSRECSAISAYQIQFMQACKDTYLWTGNNATPLLEYVNEMC